MERITVAEFNAKHPNHNWGAFGKQPKYHAKRTAALNGKVYHSAMEAGDAMVWQSMLQTKEIAAVDEQFMVRITDAEGRAIWDWKVDFKITLNDGRQKLVETKGFATRDWRILKKLTEMFYPLPLLVNPTPREVLT